MKKKQDAMSTAALEIVAMEKRQDDLQMLSLKKRDTAIAQVFESAGRVKVLSMMESQARLMKLIDMKAVKEAKSYRDELEMTWQQYCEYVGEDRRRIDDELQDIKPFKADFLAKFVSAFGVELHKIKYLGDAISANSAKILGNTIHYDGQEIVISPENKDQIQEVLERIEAAYKQDLETAQTNERAMKKIAKAKEDVISKQEKALRKFEKRAEGLGLSAEEDAFEGQMENLRIQFDGYMSRVEPDRIEELQSFEGQGSGSQGPGEGIGKVTPRMRALYITTLDYMRKQITAAHDTAVERFGADLEDDAGRWKPGK